MCDIERGEETKATIHYEQSPSERQSDSSNSSSKKLSFFVKGCVFLVIVAIVAALATLPNVVRNLNDGQGMIGNTGSDGLFPSTTASPAPPSASPTSIPSDPRLSRSFYGIDYTPHGAQAQFQCGITQQQVNQDLQVLSQLTSRIRLYGMDCDQASLVLEGIKSLQLDMGVLLTLWVDDNQTTYERQYKTFWNVVDKYGSDHILGVSVGNEAIYRNQIATSDLISLIKDVKTKLQGLGYSHIPVYTTEIKDLKHLIPEEDAVLDNVHPFFAGVHVQDAANWTWQYFYDVDQYPTIKIARELGLNETQAKPAIISEIGWPTKPKERNVEGAVPSVENMQILLETFICQANERGLPYYWFEFKDQPWKEAAFNETREAYWGLFDKDLKLKPSKMPNCPLVPWKKGDTSVPQPVPIGSRTNDAPEEE